MDYVPCVGLVIVIPCLSLLSSCAARTSLLYIFITKLYVSRFVIMTKY